MSSELLNEEPLESIDVNEKIRQLGSHQILEIPQMVAFHRWLDGKRLARQSCRVVGASRTGKTINCDVYSLKFPVTQVPGQATIVPVLYWHCPENMSVSGLFIGLLESLQYRATKGQIYELRQRLYRVLDNCQVEMIIFDEAQRASADILSEIRDISDFKASGIQISVVLVGTDRLNAVVQRDEQVLNRFLPTYRFSRLSNEDLRDITALWEKYVLPFSEPSQLTSSKAQDLLQQATQGYIGVLDRILCEAAIQSLQLGQNKIELSTLRQVVKECST